MTLTCEQCKLEFVRPGTRGPRPRFCSIKCRGRWSYHQPHIKEYQRRYARRPDRRAVHAERSRQRYATPEYRERSRERWRRENFAGVEIPAPYTGHRWLDMARQAVTGGRDFDPAFRDFGYDDEMGEAVLALLEGRDMDQALAEYRKREYVPRHLTMHLGDWGDDPDQQQRWFESVMPTVESAEDEVMIRYEVAARYHRGKNMPARNGRQRQQQPSRRRMRDAGWRKHEGRRGREEYAA